MIADSGRRDYTPAMLAGMFVLIVLGFLVWVWSLLSRWLAPPEPPELTRARLAAEAAAHAEAAARWSLVLNVMTGLLILVAVAGVALLVAWVWTTIDRQIRWRHLVRPDRDGRLPVRPEDLATVSVQALLAAQQVRIAHGLASTFATARSGGQLGGATAAEVIGAVAPALAGPSGGGLPAALTGGAMHAPAARALTVDQLMADPDLSLAYLVDQVPAPPDAVLVALQATPPSPIWASLAELGHWAIGGRTRSGKTTFALGLIALAIRHAAAQVMVLDPHFRAQADRWAPFVPWYWRAPAGAGATEADRAREIDQALAALERELDRRISEGPDVPLLVYIDEYASLVKGQRRRQAVIERILREAGKFGIWIVACGTDFLVGTTGAGTGLRGNFGRAVFFGGEDTAAASVLNGQAVDQTQLSKGWAYYRYESTTPVLVRVANVTAADLASILGAPVAPATAPAPLEATWRPGPATASPATWDAPTSPRTRPGPSWTATDDATAGTPLASAVVNDKHGQAATVRLASVPGAGPASSRVQPGRRGVPVSGRSAAELAEAVRAALGPAPAPHRSGRHISRDAPAPTSAALQDGASAGALVGEGCDPDGSRARGPMATSPAPASQRPIPPPAAGADRPLEPAELEAVRAALLDQLPPAEAIRRVWGVGGPTSAWIMTAEGREYTARYSRAVGAVLAPLDVSALPDTERAIVAGLQAGRPLTEVARAVYGLTGSGGRAWPRVRADMLAVVAGVLTVAAGHDDQVSAD